MSNPQAERAERLLQDLGRNKNWLARSLGIPKQKVYNWFDGQMPRESGTWERILSFLQAELKIAQGGVPPSSSPLDRPLIPVSYPPLPMRYAGVVPAAGEWGDPLAAEEFIDVEARYHRNDRFAATVAGTSCWPHLQPGDMTIWQRDLNPKFGLIVLAQNKGEHGCTVKELTWDSEENRAVLVALNSDESAPPDGDGWGAIARLVAVIRTVDGLERSWYLPDGLRPRHLAQ